MEPSADRLHVLGVAAWLAPYTDPNIDAIVEMLGPETQQLYLRYLADEVRSGRPRGELPPCLLALTRANREVERRNRCRHPEWWPQ
jgi:hypothetical protein